MLFDDFERTEQRLKHNRESTFTYLNSSARAPIVAARRMVEEWFGSYPESGKTDLRARFRSPIDTQHQSTFWELYLYELFSGFGFTLEPHPEIENSANHPDFLVKEGEVPKFYLEATVAGLRSAKDAGAEARLADVFDLVNKMQVPEWFLHVQHRGLPDTPPSVKELRKRLEAWLITLDSTTIDATLKAGEWKNLPRFKWQHEGLTLFIRPSPKSPQSAARSDSRPIGITMGEAHFIAADKDIKRAVEAKAKRYGMLPLPLLVAVNVLSGHCDDIDIALFGSEKFVVSFKSDGTYTQAPGTTPEGVWFGKGGTRNATVSAVLIGNEINMYSSGSTTPLLIHNPYPSHQLNLHSYPLPESVLNEASRMMQRKDGECAKEFLRLPEPWPPLLVRQPS